MFTAQESHEGLLLYIEHWEKCDMAFNDNHDISEIKKIKPEDILKCNYTINYKIDVTQKTGESGITHIIIDVTSKYAFLNGNYNMFMFKCIKKDEN